MSMSGEAGKIERSKDDRRRRLAALPPGAKLDLLEPLRDRLISLNRGIKGRAARRTGQAGSITPPDRS